MCVEGIRVGGRVAGAFDSVSRRQLLLGLETIGLGVHIRLLVHLWLVSKTFHEPTGSVS